VYSLLVIPPWCYAHFRFISKPVSFIICLYFLQSKINVGDLVLPILIFDWRQYQILFVRYSHLVTNILRCEKLLVVLETLIRNMEAYAPTTGKNIFISTFFFGNGIDLIVWEKIKYGVQ
jgi:hypothetical protein